MSLWLIGSGKMAIDYARVLNTLDVSFDVIGRGTESAKAFTKETGIEVKIGGLSKALSKFNYPNVAIVAVGVEQLAQTTKELIKSGTKRILVEKPAGINLHEIKSINSLASIYNAKVFLAYNRRFYSSIKLAKQFIYNDGGVLSANFEFTEWSHVIEPLIKGKGVKQHWLIGNSSHVIDLAFHLIGRPMDWEYWHAGGVNWHPSSARFAGAGVTEQNVMFSYIADWQAPGRWGIELSTAKHRLILRPLEELHVTKLGSLTIEKVNLDCELDIDFKPGLFMQTDCFLKSNDQLFCSLKDQVENVKLYSKIAGYPI